MSKRTIEVDDATAVALETRAAEAAELDRQWAAIKAGEPTVPHEDVVRWLDTWGTPRFRPWNSQ